jgi:divalent metal cation (Fe/Co/Zn/Cd) transporter
MTAQGIYKMDQRNMISSMILFLLAAFVLITSLGLGIGSVSNPQSGFMPFWISLLMLAFSLILFVTAYRNSSSRVRWADLWHKLHWQKSALAAAFLAAYIFFLPWAGYLIATSVLMIVLFRLTSMKTWTAALGAMLAVFFSYGLFSFILKTPLPRGIWGF